MTGGITSAGDCLCVFCPDLRARSRHPIKRYKKLIAEIFPQNQVRYSTECCNIESCFLICFDFYSDLGLFWLMNQFHASFSFIYWHLMDIFKLLDKWLFFDMGWYWGPLMFKMISN